MSDSVFNILDSLNRHAQLESANPQGNGRFEPFEHGYAYAPPYQLDPYGHAVSQHYSQHGWHPQNDSRPFESSPPMDSFGKVMSSQIQCRALLIISRSSSP